MSKDFDESSLKKVIDQTREFLEKDGYLDPFFFIGGGKKKDIIFNATIEIMQSDALKKGLAKQVWKLAKDSEAEYVVMVTESWTIQGDKVNEFIAGQKAGKWNKISECPFKQWCVYFLVETKTGHQMDIAPVIKLANTYTFGKIEMEEANEMSGVFANFLNGPKVAKN